MDNCKLSTLDKNKNLPSQWPQFLNQKARKQRASNKVKNKIK